MQCLETKKLSEEEIRALRAVWRGDATEYQQRLTLKIIVNKLSRADDLLFIPDSHDQTAFLQGRGFVGKQITKYLKLPIDQLVE